MVFSYKKKVTYFSRDGNIPEDVKFFDMKLLFLLSALCPGSRYKLRDEELSTLIQILELNLQQAAENHAHNDELPPIFLTVSISISLKFILLYLYFAG